MLDSRDALRVHSAAYHAYLLEVPVESELHSVLESDVGATKSVVSISADDSVVGLPGTNNKPAAMTPEKADKAATIAPAN